MVYFAVCQSTMDYCITSWGGAVKTHLIINVEKAQRAVDNVGACLPYRFPIVDRYKTWDVLKVRQIFILKQHSLLKYDLNLMKGKRRKGNVCQPQTLDTSSSHNFFCFLEYFLCNRLNSTFNIL